MAGNRDNPQTQSAKEMGRVPLDGMESQFLSIWKRDVNLVRDPPDSLHWNASGWISAEGGCSPTVALTHRAGADRVSDSGIWGFPADPILTARETHYEHSREAYQGPAGDTSPARGISEHQPGLQTSWDQSQPLPRDQGSFGGVRTRPLGAPQRRRMCKPSPCRQHLDQKRRERLRGVDGVRRSQTDRQALPHLLAISSGPRELHKQAYPSRGRHRSPSATKSSKAVPWAKVCSEYTYTGWKIKRVMWIRKGPILSRTRHTAESVMRHIQIWGDWLGELAAAGR